MMETSSTELEITRRHHAAIQQWVDAGWQWALTRSRYKVRAWQSIHQAVMGNKQWWDNPKRLLQIVGKAFPFPRRSGHPYQVWLSVRKTLVEAIDYSGDLPDEVAGVLEVARDSELEGRETMATELVETVKEDAYRKKCSVCGAKKGAPCLNMDAISHDNDKQVGLFSALQRAVGIPSGRYLIVPHEGRNRVLAPTP